MRLLLRYFPHIHSVELELKKNGLLRILFGIVILARYSQLLITRGYFFDYPTFTLHPIDYVLLTTLICFICGFFTSISTLVTIFFLSKYDQSFYTQTLGTDISIQFLIFLFFTNSGAHYSVDAYIGKAKGKLPALIRKINSFPGTPNISQLTTVYIFGFLSYSLVSFFAIAFHFRDEYWMHGQTISLIFTGSFLSKYYQEFRSIALAHPSIYLTASKIGVIGQSIFQVLMIPLIFIRPGKTFIFWWGLMFFIFSLVLMQLSYLPHVEILFWLSLLSRTHVKEKVEVLYDGKCNLCKRAVSILKLLNFNESIVFTSLWDAETLIQKHQLDGEQIKIWMGGIRKEKVYFGYDLYIEIAKLNPLYYLFLPLLYIGKWTGIGYRIYSLIAKNRYKLLGQCELITVKPHEPAKYQYSRHTTTFVKVFYITCFAFYFFLQFPYLDGIKRSVVFSLLTNEQAEKTVTTLNDILRDLGLETPNVFNETDLKMNEKWFVLYRVKDGEKELVPILDEHGGRLRFYKGRGILRYITSSCNFHNHGSDILYYAMTLVYRRNLIHADVAQYHQEGQEGHNIIKQIALLHKEKHSLSDSTQYYFEVRGDQSISGYSDEGKANPDRFESKVLYTGTMTL